MKPFLILAAAIFVMSGCTPAGHYPISGEECGPDDPVLDMTVPDCSPAL